MPATHRPYRITVAGVGEIVHRGIVRHSLCWNAADHLTQLGVLPGPETSVPEPVGAERSARVPVPRRPSSLPGAPRPVRSGTGDSPAGYAG